MQTAGTYRVTQNVKEDTINKIDDREIIQKNLFRTLSR